MNILNLKKINKILNEINHNFSQEKLKNLNLNSNYIKRNRKINPSIFLGLCVFFNNSLCHDSLEDLCAKLIKEDIFITKQSLNKHFSYESVFFLKNVFLHLLNSKLNLNPITEKNILNNFSKVKICDATYIHLPKSYKNKYLGFAGAASGSGIKIQLEYDLKTGNIENIDIKNGVFSDTKYLEKIESTLEKNELSLKDMGYWKLSHVKNIIEKEAFFISKLKANTNVYTKENDKYVKLNISELSNKIKEKESLELKDVYIGNEKIKLRLVLSKLPELKAKLKLEKKVKEAKKKGNKMSKESLELSNINMFVSNLSEDLTKEEILKLYSLRWQIEILFKIWKSVLNIDKIKDVKIERFECYLYGKLIYILISNKIVCTYRAIIKEKYGKEISELRLNKILYNFSEELFDIFFLKYNKIKKILKEIFFYAVKYLEKYIKKRPQFS